jgi:hypothetical protein
MSRRLKAGLWVLRLLTGCAAALVFLCLVCLFNAFSPPVSNPAIGAVIFFLLFVAFGFFMLFAFSFACLRGISRGHRIAAILALFVPVFFALPFMAVVAISEFSIAWIAIPFGLMLTAQAAIWPLAFGAASPFAGFPPFFAKCAKVCFESKACLEKGFEKCFGKWRARLKRRQARIHAEEARMLFEAATSLRQREGMPIESVIASYEDIARRYGEDEAPAVHDWVERALKEKNAILRER